MKRLILSRCIQSSTLDIMQIEEKIGFGNHPIIKDPRLSNIIFVKLIVGVEPASFPNSHYISAVNEIATFIAGNIMSKKVDDGRDLISTGVFCTIQIPDIGTIHIRGISHVNSHNPRDRGWIKEHMTCRVRQFLPS